jgi:hypothetical protein
MRTLFLLLLLLFTSDLHGQTKFVVDDFSDQYYGIVTISEPPPDPNETWIASPGSISIIEKRTERQMFKLDSQRLFFHLTEGKIVSNVKELPYGEQSIIQYEDFNFDGKKDFAVMDGQNSCYNGPSFRVYLSARRGFKLSPSFTRLAQEYCGMFAVDLKAKKLHTMTKSGCCWHQLSEFVVENNSPIAVKIVERSDFNGLTIDVEEYIRANGRLKKREYGIFSPRAIENAIFFSFGFSNGKKMRLIQHDASLAYIFTDKDDLVELVHTGSFYLSEDRQAVWFMNGKTRYTVDASGIKISSPTIKVDMEAARGTITGTLSELLALKLENVHNP